MHTTLYHPRAGWSITNAISGKKLRGVDPTRSFDYWGNTCLLKPSKYDILCEEEDGFTWKISDNFESSLGIAQRRSLVQSYATDPCELSIKLVGLPVGILNYILNFVGADP